MKKKLRIKREVRNTLIICAILMALATIFYFMIKEDEDFVKNCVSNGYTEQYCIAHK